MKKRSLPLLTHLFIALNILLIPIANAAFHAIDAHIWKGYNSPASEQFQVDHLIMMSTLFPNLEKIQQMSRALGSNDIGTIASKKADFLKRLYLLMAYAGVAFTPKDNDFSSNTPWPYPLGSILMHGQRLMIHLKNMGNAQQFYNFLLYGAPLKQHPSIDIKRHAASHGIKVRSNEVHEIKLKGLHGGAKNIYYGLRGLHKGVNIPLGGIGNQRIDGLLIGPNGHPFNPSNGQVYPNQQHGHVYIHIAQTKIRGEPQAVLLIGIEGSAPGKKNMFGRAHTASSGLTDQTKEIAVGGGKKWETLFTDPQMIPARYGGKRTLLTDAMLRDFIPLANEILAKSQEEQAEFFNNLLLHNGAEAQNYLQMYINTHMHTH